MAKQKTDSSELLETTEIILGMWVLLEGAALVGTILNRMSEGARHELTDALAETDLGETYRQSVGAIQRGHFEDGNKATRRKNLRQQPDNTRNHASKSTSSEGDR